MVRRSKSVLSAVIAASAVTLVLGAGGTASAQSTSTSQGTPAPAAAKWEFEFHAGGTFGGQPTGGTAIGTFPVGESFSAPITGVQSRYASTWSFGDGARLLNQITAGFFTIPTSIRIQTLDPVLTSTGVERKGGLDFGGRVSRRLTSRLTAEFNVDSTTRTIDLTDAAVTGIEATRATFGPVWTAIIGTGAGLFTDPSTSATTTLTNGTRMRETALTGAVNIEVARRGRLVPYLSAGGGVLRRSGALPAATLTGNYQFRFLGLAPLNETDVVKVHFALKETAPVGVFGGGVKYALSGRQGLRVDWRVHVSRNSLDTLVDATPARVTSTTFPFSIPSATVPTLVFSNTTTRSSLSGPAISDLKTFTGSGMDLQSSLTAGYFVRFGTSPTTRAGRAPRAAPVTLAGSKWELEAHVGGGSGKQPTGGTPLAAFPVGESFTTTGLFARPSRYASTWYFGDGALLLNQIGTGFGGVLLSATKVTPLDPVLTTTILERKPGLSVGGRLSRRFTRTVSGEFGVESVSRSARMTGTALAGLEATRASFAPVWNAVFATGITLFLDPVVTSELTLPKETNNRQTLVTGAATFELPGRRRIVPYATVGGGVLLRSGELPKATLTGNYQFRFGGFGAVGVPYSATDVVDVHFAEKDSTPVGVFGGGVKYALTARHGLRADVRVHISRNSLDTLVNARPSSTTSTPVFTLTSATTPAFVLSNSSTTRSNLSGPPIVDLKTFTGSGRDVQTNVTVGYFVRF